MIFSDFLFYLSTPRVANTNPNCVLKTDIVCDRSPPTVAFAFTPAVHGEFNSRKITLSQIKIIFNLLLVSESSKLKEVKLDATNLTTLELIQLCNKYVSALAPKEEPVNTIKTKSEKKASGSKGGKKR